MSRFAVLSSCLAFALLLSACAAGPESVAYDDGPLTPLPHEFIPQDPEDHILAAAIRDYLDSANGPASTQYDFTRVDLDGDNRRDALVMMKGPHHYWCGMDGCSLVVFKAANDHFTLVSEIFPVRGPMYVSERMSEEGWKNLIIRVSGQAYAKAKDVSLEFDGQTYPRNPFFQPAIVVSQADHGQRLFP